MAHTPGPWRLWTAGDDPGAFVIHGDSPCRVGGITGENMVIAQRTIGTPEGSEGLANAHLIAAAPDLLAALNAACGYLLNARIDLETGCRKATAIATIDGGLTCVRAAIAKAEGAK